MTGIDIRFPEMRERVIFAVRHLADQQYQQKIWMEQQYPHPDYYDDFSLTLNSLDDTAVLDDPVAAIGITLSCADEAEAMRRLADRLDEIINTVGGQSPDSHFLASPLWSGVIEAAQDALEVLTR
ncbi:hypothetical protein [Streptomyces sp. MST-110588]|uniref:SCO4402 family protein n=1 Tax=Streptomyces sp. MST-110588 TaxID=2833628 RepID=UPI001F5D3035|nr:hypothetical protein [Streptomyces sp. MST-110588]UNO42983.1 hypothetical protein KGS77_30085 [Streptomyces sp. MST-110588]